MADLDRYPAFSFQKPCRLGGDDPVGAKTVRAAIEGLVRIEIADFVLQISNVLRLYIGRVCGN